MGGVLAITYSVCVCVFDEQLQYVEYCRLDNFGWSRLFEKSLQTGLIHDVSFFVQVLHIYSAFKFGI